MSNEKTVIQKFWTSCSDGWITMEPSDKGTWGRYADHSKAVAAQTAELDALKAEVARLSAPVTEEELAPYMECIQPSGEDASGWYVAADQVQNIIAARATPPQPTGGKR